MWRSLPGSAKGVIISFSCWFASLFIMAVRFNTWTQLLFYFCLMAIVLSALIPTFRLPWVSAFDKRYDETKSNGERFGIIFTIAMCFVGVLWIGVDWFAHVVLLFK